MRTTAYVVDCAGYAPGAVGLRAALTTTIAMMLVIMRPQSGYHGRPRTYLRSLLAVIAPLRRLARSLLKQEA